jgi:hypothetical protein
MLTSDRSRLETAGVQRLQRAPTLQRNGGTDTAEVDEQTVALRTEASEQASEADDTATRALVRIGMLGGWLRQLTELVADIDTSGAESADAQQLVRTLTARFGKATGQIRRSRDKLTLAALDLRTEAGRAAGAADAATSPQALATAVGDAYAANAALVRMTAEVGDVIGDLSRQAATMARAARTGGAAELAGSIIALADKADTEAQIAPPPAPKLNFGGKAKTHGHDRREAAVTDADALNNVASGLGGGTFSAIEAVMTAVQGGETVALISAAATTAIGVTAGVLGIVFGLVGLGVGLHAMWRGDLKRKELKALIPSLSHAESKQIAAYAAAQKRKKKLGGGMVAVIGGAAILAGVAGLVALSVASMGIGAAVLGIGIAALGIGLLVGKWVHKRNKRAKAKNALKELAAGLVEGVVSGDAAAKKNAEESIRSYGADPAQIAKTDEKQFTKSLVEAMSAQAMSKRAEMAEKTVNYLVSGSPSQQFDAEMIVETLGLKPEKLRSRVAAGNAATAKDRVMRKLSSW